MWGWLQGFYLMEIIYNAYCEKCKASVQVKNEKEKCPKCKSKVEIKGRVLNVSTSNGIFRKHY